MNRDQRRHAAATQIFGAYRVTRTLRRDHDHVDVRARNHLVVMHVEAMRESERRTLLDIGLDIAVIDSGDGFVGQQHHHYVSILDRLRDLLYLEPGLLRLGP